MFLKKISRFGLGLLVSSSLGVMMSGVGFAADIGTAVIMEVPFVIKNVAGWDGICGSPTQPGAPVTLGFAPDSGPTTVMLTGARGWLSEDIPFYDGSDKYNTTMFADTFAYSGSTDCTVGSMKQYQAWLSYEYQTTVADYCSTVSLGNGDSIMMRPMYAASYRTGFVNQVYKACAFSLFAASICYACP